MNIEPRIKLILFFSMVALLIGNGLILYKNYRTEWRRYQEGYLEQAYEKATDSRTKEIIKERSPRIEQLIIRKFGDERVERCITCHTGIDDPRFADAPHPFKTHPDIIKSHPYREYGCTMCHDGNGRGLTSFDAHGKDKYWLRPLLTGSFTEAACAKCHPSPYLDETPNLRLGARLFMNKACYGCHMIKGVSKGKLGVELTEVGNKWHKDYLEESIVNPKANNPESLMPHMAVAQNELKALVIYLKSLTNENLIDGPVRNYMALKKWENQGKPSVEVSIKTGMKLFQSKGCTACHQIDGSGGQVGPDLSQVGLQRTREWLIQHFINPRSLVAGSLMPDFELSPSEMQALTMFLMERKGSLAVTDEEARQ